MDSVYPLNLERVMISVSSTLTVSTDGLEAAEVTALRRVMNETLASFAAVDLDPAAVFGWTAATAADLLSRLEQAHRPVQAAVIRIEARGDGTCTRDDVYMAGNYSPDRSLNGFTKPVGGIIRAMQAEGLLPHDAADPMRPIYDTANTSFQKAQGFQMHPDLVPVFAAARETASAGVCR